MNTPCAVIADDEPLLRERLQTLLARLWPQLQIVGCARNGREAVEMVESQPVDIAFLDIRMPVMTGIEAARMLNRQTRVVFVTAFEEYAVRAFETGAIDYVVKPIDEERLAVTVGRLQERLPHQAPDMSALLTSLAAQHRVPSSLQWIRASVGNHVKLVSVADVLFFQSDEKYTRVVTTNGEVLIRKTIRELTDELDATQFAQIHRSTIVNLRAVDRVTRTPMDYLELNVKGASDVLRVSRNYVHLFRQM
jgi:DNA-binding LytR/AlgR family response regulator